MTGYITKATKSIHVLLISVSLFWGSTAIADDYDGVHKGDKKKVIHDSSDGHKHKKKRKKSKKVQHKNHKHMAGSHEDEEHHDEDDSHDHSDHKHKKKPKKKKGKKKHKGHKHKQEHQDDDDHDHQHGDENDHSEHSDSGKKHEGHAGHGGHDEHGDESFGEGKAITEVKNEGESFKLDDEAQSLLGIRYDTIKKSVKNNVFTVPTKSVIFFNDEKGIFVKIGDWFKLVDVKLVKKEASWSQVKSDDLSVGSTIVVSGTGLLRVAHLQASGQGGKGHAH